MDFGPKRGNILFIFENFIKDFGLLMLTLIIALFKHNIGVLTDNIGVMIIVFIGPISRIIEYLCTYYSIDKEKLTVKCGWLVKKNIEIPLSTITTVDLTQNIIHQIFGVYRLNVDNASNISDTETKVKMTFSKADALQVKELLTKGESYIDGLNPFSDENLDNKEKNLDYHASIRELIMLGILKSKMAFFLEIVVLFNAFWGMFGKSLFSDEQIENFFLFQIERSGIAVMIFSVLLICFIIAVICGGIGSFVRYYDFHVTNIGGNLIIEYGLLTKKRYTLPQNKISGFYYQQSILMRLLKIGSVHIFAIGYGGDSDADSSEDPILFPLINEKMLPETMSKIINETTATGEWERPKSSSLRYFFFNIAFATGVILAAVLIGISLLFDYLSDLWIVGLFVLIIGIASTFFQYKNAAIRGNNSSISMTYGGFKKTMTCVKINNIESISESAGIFKHRKDVTSISIGYIAPLAYANQKVKNVSVETFERLKELLIY